jgi:lipopolysaccharide biosynthesis glycosyltransferase
MVKFLITTDQNLVPYLPTIVNSISAHHDNAHIYFLTTPCVGDIPAMLREIGFPQVEFTQKVVELESIMTKRVICNVTSKAMFLRMWAPEVLPDVDKVIYLDVDTIVNANLETLYTVEETGPKGIAGVVDLFTPTIWNMLSRSFYNGPDVVLPNIDFVAFNSGVLIMDLDKMRANKSLEFMLNILSRAYMTDQPLMNLYAHGEFTQLPRELNVSANHLHRFNDYTHYTIIHWHGKKPWDEERPLQEYYQKYRIS